VSDARATFDRYHEKVIDQTLPFSPPPADCAQIVFGKCDDYAHLAELLTMLPLSNIRVMRQALWLMDDLAPLLTKRHADTVQLIRDHVLMLTAFVRDESLQVDVSKLPEISILEFYYDQRDEADESTKTLFKHLQEWGFESIDSDQFIISRLKHGVCNIQSLESTLDEIDRKYSQKDVRVQYEAMWSLYRQNFQSTEQEVIAAFTAFLDSYSGWLSDDEFSQCKSVIQNLGSSCNSIWNDDFLKYHIPSANLKRLAIFEKQTSNQELLAAIHVRQDLLQRGMTIIGTMKKFMNDSGWNPDMVEFLVQQPIDTYCQEILSSNEPKLLRYLVAFGESWRSAGASERQVVQKLVEALEIVAKKSDLHRIRSHWVLDEVRPRASEGSTAT
jgi:hypothetical protein